MENCSTHTRIQIICGMYTFSYKLFQYIIEIACHTNCVHFAYIFLSSLLLLYTFCIQFNTISMLTFFVYNNSILIFPTFFILYYSCCKGILLILRKNIRKIKNILNYGKLKIQISCKSDDNLFVKPFWIYIYFVFCSLFKIIIKIKVLSIVRKSSEILSHIKLSTRWRRANVYKLILMHKYVNYTSINPKSEGKLERNINYP